MIDLYYWNTPNGHKITMMLEETGLAYRILRVNISQEEQFKPAFLAISPNNKIPAIVDHEPKDHKGPLSVFESGAILTYLAEKTGKFLPADLRLRFQILEWLTWQVAGFGPMLGQLSHFLNYAPEKIPYGIERYRKEAERLFGVLNTQLIGKDGVAGAYSIADMAIYPWAMTHERLQIDLAPYPAVRTWLKRVSERPATQAAYEKGDQAVAKVKGGK